MLRKTYGLIVLLCASGMVLASSQDKGKDVKTPTKEVTKTASKEVKGTKATLVKADVDKKILIVTIDSKKVEFPVTKDIQFIGPRGGVSKEGLKDDRLTVGAELTLVLDGKALKEVHLPFRAKKDDKSASKTKDTTKPK